ncbi:GtrA family protein [Kluyvera ascorbata]|uniref:GtrA family protein n=1 Tax=Kluyvera ascorbata TaxID=51288 RepID=UPI0038F706DC
MRKKKKNRMYNLYSNLLSLVKSTKFRRFIITGLLATFLHFAIALFLIFNYLISPAFANAFAFLMTTIISYFINTLWSFSQKIKVKNTFRYAMTACIGFSLSYLVSSISGLLFPSPVISIFFVAVFVPPVVFFIHNKWTYLN